MTRDELRNIIALGEDSTRQFKADVRNAASHLVRSPLVVHTENVSVPTI